MQTIYDLLTLELENEHDLEHKPEHKKKYSDVKIYDGNGDLSKRWYIYFSYLNPDTGKYKRSKNIYGKTNRYKTKYERYALLNTYKKRLSKLLAQGYSPYKHNQAQYDQSDLKQQLQRSEINARADQDNACKIERAERAMTISEAFDFVFSLKSNTVGASTLSDYKSRCAKLRNWLSAHHKDVVSINDLLKTHINEFLNEILQRTSARNRNNYRTCFSSIFQSLEDNDIIPSNFVKQLKPIKTKPYRHKRYSAKEQKAIFDYLEKEDKVLLLFIKFVGYNLLRPIEICRLRIKDIDLEQKTLRFQAKNQKLKTKRIPKLLLRELPDISKMNPEAFLFTPDGLGQFWDAKEINRRDYFTKQFKSVVKDHFGFDQDYGLYSFRHTFITKIYRGILKTKTPFEAKSQLMLITGHKSMGALEKYLREIDAELPQDYSDLL